MSNPIFIVGTGRCGSTMLSDMLNLSPTILSLSEFFVSITDLGTLLEKCFPKHQISATEFWDILAAPTKKQNLMIRNGIAMKEVLYQVDENSHFNNHTGVPAIVQTTLPHLTHEPETLFYGLEKFILSLPNATISEMYTQCFEWLKTKLDKKIWVERSGGSLRVVHRYYDTFPNAKFLHIVRDGRNCAFSMEKHKGFRMVMIVFQLIEILGIDPFEDSNRDGVGDLFDDIACFLPENFDVKKFEDYYVSPSLYGYYWSGEIEQGLEELDKIPENQKMTIKYEDILAAPQVSMEKIAEFIGKEYCSDAWIAQTVAVIKSPQSNPNSLTEKEQKRLNDSCKKGFELLAQQGIMY